MIICDFNVPFRDVSVGTRAGLAFNHAVNCPAHVVKAIVEIVKLVFIAIACAVTLGKSPELNQYLKLTCVKGVIQIVDAAVSALGVFAPLNAMKWKAEAYQGIMSTTEDWFVGESLANGFAALNMRS
ncbi:hypothetical protein [Estrella lausannensis]|uniref:Uncharacterized protein n=1 Tax=Estrella lausannensis TaxID=483423 RepID=A0A0H5DRS6_9BACT|nr:hypothetical protein [Estrella lausannensis]CRX39416.1 hypothetical protein ELAC_2095 [Estrella lausannensis]